MKNRFYDIYLKHQDLGLNVSSERVTERHVRRALFSEKVSSREFLALLFSEKDELLEDMAQRARDITLRNFGKVKHIYTPMYLSDFCENDCCYCGFRKSNEIKRKTLSLEEVKKEADFLSAQGFDNILILTGGSRKEAPLDYIKRALRIIREKFSSVSIEIYELSLYEYKELIGEGVDGLTVYQEVYDRDIYGKVHLSGPKTDYLFRMDAPERALQAGMRTVNIGPLLGLAPWKKEVFFAGLHADYLQRKFPEAEISVSVPRIRPQVSNFQASCRVTDRDLVRIITSLRMFLPRAGITLSTRENARLRENLLPIGVTRMSAGSTTRVGGHTLGIDGTSSGQFEISDNRKLREISKMLSEKGYQPVMKDWVNFWKSPVPAERPGK